MLLGHPTYLMAKAGGDNSMSEKAGCSEAAKLHARRGPDGMVKAELLEPQCPCSKPGLVGNGGCNPTSPEPSVLFARRACTPGEQVVYNDPKDTDKAPKPS
jgi:hypothetical protein